MYIIYVYIFMYGSINRNRVSKLLGVFSGMGGVDLISYLANYSSQSIVRLIVRLNVWYNDNKSID